MEEQDECATQEPVVHPATSECSSSSRDHTTTDDEDGSDDYDWQLQETEMTLGSDSDSSDDKAGAEHPPRWGHGRRKGSRNRQKRQRSEQQQALELLATEGEHEHEELSMEGIEQADEEATAEESTGESAESEAPSSGRGTAAVAPPVGAVQQMGPRQEQAVHMQTQPMSQPSPCVQSYRLKGRVQGEDRAKV